MSNPSWLKKLSPGELQLMRDLADVVKRTALNGGQHTVATAELRQEVKRRGKNNIISTNGASITRSKRG
jgi:predicted ThiF/HesA family dinucleotide-utilizing enzyme